MWRPTYIEAINFRTYKHLQYDFLQGKSVVVYGQNLDDGEGADSNGSGKSNIMNAIQVAVAGVETSVPKSEYVRDGEAYTEIEMGWVNEPHNMSLVIKRKIYAKSTASKIELIENGEINKQITSWNEGSARVLELFDVTKDDLLNYYIINQDNSHSFFLATDGKKKEIISRFSDKGMIDEIIESVKLDIEEVKQNLLEEEAILEEQASKIATLEEQVEYEQKGRKNDVLEGVAELKEERKELKEDILELEKKQAANNTSLEKATNELKEANRRLAKLDVDDIKKKKQETTEERAQQRLEKKELDQLIGGMEKTLAGAVECPKCHHEFSTTDPDTDVEELKALKVESEKLMESYEEELEELAERLEKAQDKLDSHRTLANTVSRLKTEVENLKSRQENRLATITSKKKELKRLKKAIMKAKEFSVNNKRIADLKKSINLAVANKEAAQQKIDKYNSELADLRYWEVNFGVKGFKTYVVNSVLELLEGHVNSYLSRFKVKLEVKLNGFKKTASGEVRENIDVLVSKADGNWHNLRRFSGGQTQRINVCGVLTLQNLINQTSKYGGLDLLILDEFFEGLDVKGQKMVLPILEASGTTNLIISHHNNDIGAVNQLNVLYQNGESKIV